MRKFWLDDEDDLVLGPIKKKDIVLAEEKLGIELPKLYKKLVKKQNGGYIKRTVFPIDFSTESVEDYIEVDSIFGIGEDGILDSEYLIKEWELPNDLVLLNGEGHTWVAMDYRGKTKNPSIVYIDVEEEVEFQIARSFSEFIERLEEEDIVDEDEITGDMDIPNLEEITKEEAEHIFKTSDDKRFIRSVIINLPLDKDGVNWFLDQLIFLLDKYNSTGIAEDAADFFLIHHYLRGKMDDSKYSLLMNKLNALPYKNLKTLQMIDERERRANLKKI
ncbi:SMI1/KNR4 family protein [Oceanobacillus chungangensis]|nr:SMI1/KNR4 family protein [Oceanobacillus chungangensis]